MRSVSPSVRQWQHDLSFFMVGQAADAVAQQNRNDVGLPELCRAGIEHDGLAIGQLMIDAADRTNVRRAAHLYRALSVSGVVDVETRRFEDVNWKSS
jgi:hypothetical protein